MHIQTGAAHLLTTRSGPSVSVSDCLSVSPCVALWLSVSFCLCLRFLSRTVRFSWTQEQ